MPTFTPQMQAAMSYASLHGNFDTAPDQTTRRIYNLYSRTVTFHSMEVADQPDTISVGGNNLLITVRLIPASIQLMVLVAAPPPPGMKELLNRTSLINRFLSCLRHDNNTYMAWDGLLTAAFKGHR